MVLQPEQAGNRAGDPGPQMIAVGPALVQRSPFLGNIARRVPMLKHQDGGEFIHFLIGHLIM